MHYNVFADAVRDARAKKQETGEEHHVIVRIGKEGWEGPFTFQQVLQKKQEDNLVMTVFSTDWESVVYNYEQLKDAW